MKHGNRIATLIVTLVMLLSVVLAGCGGALAAPENVRMQGDVLMWNSVEGAQSYVIYADDDEIYQTTNIKYDLSKADLEAGKTYEITLCARGDGYVNKSSGRSEAVSYTPQAEVVTPDESEEDVQPVEDNALADTLYQAGLGYGVNALTEECAVDTMGYGSIFKEEVQSKFGKRNTYTSRLESKSTNSIEEMAKKIEKSLVMSSDISVSCGGLFTLGLEEKFSLSSDIDNKYRKNQYYYLLNLYFNSSCYELTGYRNSNNYSGMLSDQILSDLQKVEEGKLTPEMFFVSYGTHVRMAVTYGVKTEVSYSRFSSEEIKSTEIKKAFDSAFSAGVSADDLSASVAVNNSASLDETYTSNKSSTQSNLSITTTGKKSLIVSTFTEFADGFNTWKESVNDPDNFAITDVADGGLVPIWYYFQDEYPEAAKKIEAYFNEQSSKMAEALRSKVLYVPSKAGDTENYGGGSGTSSDPYLISNATHLKNIKNDMNKYYRLTNDIDLSDIEQWEPIGGCYLTDIGGFTGTLDGDGYSIKNLSRTKGVPEKESRSYFGFFGWIEQSGVVKDINFEDVAININGPTENNDKMRAFFGIVAGRCDGTIENVTTSGTMRTEPYTNGESLLGGIVGYLHGGTVNNCTNEANLYGHRYAVAVGGIVGAAYGGKVTNNTNKGDLVGDGGTKTLWVRGGYVFVASCVAVTDSNNHVKMSGNSNQGTLTAHSIAKDKDTVKKENANSFGNERDANY